MTVDPSMDGVDHIRIHQKAKTWIGRHLEIGAHNPFHHPQHGYFASLLAFQMWLVYQDNLLRRITHDDIKSTTIAKNRHIDNFYGSSIESIDYIIEQNPRLKKTLIQTTLPLFYYDVIFDEVYEVPRMAWYIQKIDQWRSQ